MIHVTQDRDVPEFLLDEGAHLLTAYEWGRQQRQRYDDLPRLVYAELQIDQVVAEPDAKYAYQIHRIGVRTPKGTQVVTRRMDGHPGRLYRSQYGCSRFVLLDERTQAVLGIRHRAVVARAVARGLDVPPRVRREYPDLFVALPERFSDDPARDWKDYLRCALEKGWGREPSAATMRVAIDNRLAAIRELRTNKTRAASLNPDVAQDYDAQEADDWRDVDFYRWLLPLLEPGGVFFLPAKEDSPCTS